MGPVLVSGMHRGLRRGLRDDSPKCCEQYIKSDFGLYLGPYVLLRSDFDSKGQAQCPFTALTSRANPVASYIRRDPKN